jgi:hypothetical protein
MEVPTEKLTCTIIKEGFRIGVSVICSIEPEESEISIKNAYQKLKCSN